MGWLKRKDKYEEESCKMKTRGLKKKINQTNSLSNSSHHKLEEYVVHSAMRKRSQ